MIYYRKLSPIKRLLLMNKLGGGGSVVVKTVTQAAPITIHAVSKPIVSLTQDGKVTQASTPTPSSPVDIVCNNGTLKMVDDELPTGYKRVLGFECNNNAMWEITGFNLKGSDTVRISFSIEAACNVWGCYQGTAATDNYDLYASVSAGSKYLRYGSGTYLSYWSPDDLGQRFDVVYTPNGSQGMPQDSTWTPKTFTSANDLLIGSTTVGGTSAKLKGNLYGSIKVDGRLNLIPCERVSDGVLGYYDTYTATFYEPYEGYDGAVSLGYDGSHYHLETVGTAEVLTVTPTASSTQDGTPSPNNPVPIVSTKMGDTVLRAIGDASDEYDPATQTITRRIGVKVLDGTEDYGASSNMVSRHQVYLKNTGVINNGKAISTHYDATTGSNPANGKMSVYGSNIFFCDTTNITGSSTSEVQNAFKEFAAAQYAAGTPIIVLYPLAEPTTEAYTGSPVGGTASVADLFACGDITDTQNIITGAVTHNCGVYVVTGEENWVKNTSYSSLFYSDCLPANANLTPPCVCTHYSGLKGSTAVSSMTNSTIKTGTLTYRTRLYTKDTTYSTDNGIEAYFAEQYAAGTPVIIVYPLAEETTEQVTPQSLHTAKGTNTVSVTSNVDPVTLTVVYKGTDDGGGSVGGDDEPGGGVPFD